jgi:hypothetical protein
VEAPPQRVAGLCLKFGKQPMSKKAKDITVGETVFNRGQSFIVKEVRVDAERGWIAFLDTEGFWHGWYHPDEYLGVGP